MQPCHRRHRGRHSDHLALGHPSSVHGRGGGHILPMWVKTSRRPGTRGGHSPPSRPRVDDDRNRVVRGRPLQWRGHTWGPSGDHTACTMADDQHECLTDRTLQIVRDVRKRLPPRPGGQGVASSNLAVPDAGQRPFPGLGGGLLHACTAAKYSSRVTHPWSPAGPRAASTPACRLGRGPGVDVHP